MQKIINKLLKFFYRFIPRKIRLKLFYIYGLKSPRQLFQSLKKYNELRKNTDQELKNWRIWKRSFKRNIWAQPKNIDIFRSFLLSEVRLIKESENVSKRKGVTLICVVKNDLERMKLFYRHYRKIGIEHFVIIDNNSDDGTREWLLKQPDSDIYLAKDQFFSRRKYGWINKILSLYGFERWYLYVDSDELFVFNDIENYNINDLVRHADIKGIKRFAALMIDMYSDKPLYKRTSDKLITDEYIYFDKNSYEIRESYRGLDVRGGPRRRMLSCDSKWKGPLLIKHPLFYFEEGNIFESAHYIFPFKHINSVYCGLLHYKFLDTDLERYKEIALKGNFADGSSEYKQYMQSYKKNQDLTFLYEGSEKYKDSSSLKEIPFIKEIEWK